MIHQPLHHTHGMWLALENALDLAVVNPSETEQKNGSNQDSIHEWFTKLLTNAAAIDAIAQVGDWGRQGNQNQMDVATLMGQVAELAQPSFVISTGDNFVRTVCHFSCPVIVCCNQDVLSVAVVGRASMHREWHDKKF
eukprot:1159930-Pelagomonas_calceolata.AAC.2